MKKLPKPQIKLSLRTYVDTRPWSFGERFMQAMIDADPRLTPERVGFCERYKGTYTTLEEFEPWWVPYDYEDETQGLTRHRHSFLWKRRANPKMVGDIHHSALDIKGGVWPSTFKVYGDWVENTDFTAIFRQWIIMANPFLAILHLFTPPEQLFDVESMVGEFDEFRGNWVDFQTATFGHGLNPIIPNIGWAMVYGGKFAADVDAERISAAGFPIERIGDAWLVCVTEKLTDVVTDFAYFSARRAELKKLFRDDMFVIKEEPPGYEGVIITRH